MASKTSKIRTPARIQPQPLGRVRRGGVPACQGSSYQQ